MLLERGDMKGGAESGCEKIPTFRFFVPLSKSLLAQVCSAGVPNDDVIEERVVSQSFVGALLFGRCYVLCCCFGSTIFILLTLFSLSSPEMRCPAYRACCESIETSRTGFLDRPPTFFVFTREGDIASPPPSYAAPERLTEVCAAPRRGAERRGGSAVISTGALHIWTNGCEEEEEEAERGSRNGMMIIITPSSTIILNGMGRDILFLGKKGSRQK